MLKNIIFVCLSCVYVTNAHAFFTYEQGGGADGEQKSNGDDKKVFKCPGNLRELNKRGIAVPLISGFGRNMPFNAALKVIAPKDWSIKGDDIGLVTTWRGDKPWDEALREAAHNSHACVTLDFDGRTIYVRRLVDDLTSQFLVTQQKPRSMVQPNTLTPPDSTTAGIDMNIWVLEPHKTLSENIANWCKKAGWELAWNAPGVDYMVSHQVVLTGSFMDSLKVLMKAYSKAQHPVAIKAHNTIPTRVLEVVPYTMYHNNSTN